MNIYICRTGPHNVQFHYVFKSIQMVTENQTISRAAMDKSELQLNMEKTHN